MLKQALRLNAQGLCRYGCDSSDMQGQIGNTALLQLKMLIVGYFEW